MDNQYQFIEQLALPEKKVEETRKMIIERWEEFTSLGIDDLGFLLEKQRDTPRPNWWLENEELFRAVIIIAYSVHFLASQQMVISLRRGYDILVSNDEVSSLAGPQDFIDHLYKQIEPKGYGFPRRILAFKNMGANKVSLHIGTLVTLDEKDQDDLHFDDYINPTNLNDQAFDAETDINEDFKKITIVLSELAYSANVRDIGKMIDKFNALEEHCYMKLWDPWKKACTTGQCLVENTPTLCFVHELAYYGGRIVDSFTCRTIKGSPMKCNCTNPNCGTIHVEHGPINIFNTITNRFIVLDQVNLAEKNSLITQVTQLN